MIGLRVFGVAAVSVLLMSSCASRDPGQPPTPGLNVYSKEQDIQLGQQAAAEVRKQVDIVDNARLQQYIDRVGNRLANQKLAQDYPYEFTLINDPSINAFALPGGPIFVNSGLIRAAENEAQVAGVLAHEIAHVALRHGTSQASKANLLQLPAVLAGAIIGQGSVAAQAGQIGLGLGLNMLMLKYSRGAEEEADALGAQLMAAAGYNPLEMARFFEKLEAEGGDRAPQFLSSHPSPGNRVQDVREEIQALPQREYALNQTGQFDEAKQLVAQLPKPEERMTRARAANPSYTPRAVNATETFNAGRFAINHPHGWRVYGSPNASTVTIAPEEALVRGRGGVDVGLGVVAGYYTPDTPSASIEVATKELVQDLTRSNPRMSVVEGPRPVQVGGMQGRVVTLRSASPFGGTEVDTLVTISRPEGPFYLAFIAPENARDQVRGLFDEMLQSVRFR